MKLSKILFCWLTLFCLSITPSKAWDIDTHFYSTYALSRYVGFNHEVALCFAIGNQWIDESAWTTPMGSLIIGSRLRRLYHFAGNRTRVDSEAHGLFKMKTVTMARPNDPIGAELILESARKGDCLGIGAGLHTRDDTTGHQGFPAELGHALSGHWPDRTWVDSAGQNGLPRYRAMLKNKIGALVAVREIMMKQRPELQNKFLDKTFFDTQYGNTPHYPLPAEELYRRFSEKEEVNQLSQNDVFKDPRYTRIAVNHLIDIAIESGYIKNSAADQTLKLTANGILVDSLQLPEREFVKGIDVRELSRKQILFILEKEKELGREIFDRAMIYRELLYSEPLQAPHNNYDPNLLTAEEYGVEKIVNKIVDKLCEGLIPRPLSGDWLVEIESEGPLRKLEMEIRTGDWIQFNRKIFGQVGAVKFERRGIFEQLRRGVVNFHQLMNKGNAKDLDTATEDYVRVVSATAVDQMRWWKLHFIYAWLDSLPGIGKMRYRSSWKNFLSGNTRLKADSYNLLIDHIEKFRGVIDSEFKKKILTPTERDELNSWFNQSLEFLHGLSCIISFDIKDKPAEESWISKEFTDIL